MQFIYTVVVKIKECVHNFISHLASCTMMGCERMTPLIFFLRLLHAQTEGTPNNIAQLWGHLIFSNVAQLWGHLVFSNIAQLWGQGHSNVKTEEEEGGLDHGRACQCCDTNIINSPF